MARVQLRCDAFWSFVPANASRSQGDASRKWSAGDGNLISSEISFAHARQPVVRTSREARGPLWPRPLLGQLAGLGQVDDMKASAGSALVARDGEPVGLQPLFEGWVGFLGPDGENAVGAERGSASAGWPRCRTVDAGRD
jgi:hypothetical protein